MVRFHLKEPWPDFMTFYGTTATAAGIVVPKKYLTQVGDDGFKKQPIGAGPYKFVSHKPGIEVVLEAYPGLLAPRAQRQDAGHEERPRGHHARGDAEDRRGRHRLRARRPRRRGAQARPAPAGRGVEARLDLLDRVHRAVGPEVAVARQAAAPGGEPRARPQAHQRGGCLGFCPPAGVIVPRVMDFALQVEPPPYDLAKAKQLLAEAGYPNGFDAGEFAAIPGFPTVADAVMNYLNAAGIRVRMRPMERATFYAAWQEKKLRGLFMTAVGNSGNAASRVEAFMQSKGAYAYGGYPDIDELFQQQASRARRQEARGDPVQDPAAHDRPRDVRAGHGPARPDGRRPARRQAHDHRRVDEPVPVLRGHGAQELVPAHGEFDQVAAGRPRSHRAGPDAGGRTGRAVCRTLLLSDQRCIERERR